MFKLLRKLCGAQSLEDILGVFHKARADLEKFIAQRDEEISHHESMISFHKINALGLADVKADALNAHSKLTALISPTSDAPVMVTAADTAS